MVEEGKEWENDSQGREKIRKGVIERLKVSE